MSESEEFTLTNSTRENGELITQIDTLRVRVYSSDASTNSAGSDSQKTEKSNNIVILNAEEEPVDSASSPINPAETVRKTLDLNIPIHRVALTPVDGLTGKRI